MEPTRTQPIVAESMRELLNKSDNERAGGVRGGGEEGGLHRDVLPPRSTGTRLWRRNTAVFGVPHPAICQS